jgi:hypothetical protein
MPRGSSTPFARGGIYVRAGGSEGLVTFNEALLFRAASLCVVPLSAVSEFLLAVLCLIGALLHFPAFLAPRDAPRSRPALAEPLGVDSALGFACLLGRSDTSFLRAFLFSKDIALHDTPGSVDGRRSSPPLCLTLCGVCDIIFPCFNVGCSGWQELAWSLGLFAELTSSMAQADPNNR